MLRRVAPHVLVALTIVIVALPIARRLDSKLTPSSRIDGAPSVRVDLALEEQFGSPFSRTAVLVIGGLHGAATDDGRSFIRSVVSRIAALPFVTATASPATSLDSLFVGVDGRGAIVLVGIDASADEARAIDALRTTTRTLATVSPPGLTFQWTGQAVLDRDLREAGVAEARGAEARAAPLALLLGLWAFGGIGTTLLGLAAGALTVTVALAVASLAANVVPMTALAPSIVSLLGLALGIDYALFLMKSGADHRRARRTVAVAAIAVAAAVAPLMIVPVSELRSAGVAGLAAASAAFAVAMLLSSALSRYRETTNWRPVFHPVISARAGGRIHSWGRKVTAKPGLALTFSLVPLLVFAFPVTRMRVSVPGPEELPRSMESVRALETLTSMGRVEAALRLRVLVTFDGMDVFSPEGWAAIARFERDLLDDARVSAVRSVHTAAGGVSPAALRTVLPESVQRAFVSRDGRLALLEVVPASGLRGEQLFALIRELRTRSNDNLTLQVGGVPAFGMDYAETIARHAFAAVGLSLVAALVVVFIALRSVLIAVKTVLLNLLSVAAALGLTTLVFQDGIGASLFSATPLDGIFPTVPMLAFCAVFGIGMDYEIFLVTRVADARREGHPHGAAVVAGLVASGTVITRAAAVMTAVFTAFLFSGFLSVRMIGFALTAAIILDVTLIRLIAAPALLQIAGDWNWWPGERGRLSASSPGLPMPETPRPGGVPA